jgi:hypothetical protein
MRMADPGMVYEAPLFIVLGEREYRDDCMVDFHHWIETVDGVIIDPTAGQFELGEPALMIAWPDSPAYARYVPWRLQTARTHERRHQRHDNRRDSRHARGDSPSRRSACRRIGHRAVAWR